MRHALRTCLRGSTGWLAGLVLLVLLCATVHSQTATTSPTTTNPKEKPMQHYALIFHTTRPLTPEEVQRRGPEIQAWVKTVNSKGFTLDPRAFGETVATLSQQQG